MADRPRTFADVVAATDPAVRERAQHYRDPAVQNNFHADVILQEYLNGNGEWLVAYRDDDGGCYATYFAGPEAERRARDYFEALKAGRIRTVRACTLDH